MVEKTLNQQLVIRVPASNSSSATGVIRCQFLQLQVELMIRISQDGCEDQAIKWGFKYLECSNTCLLEFWRVLQWYADKCFNNQLSKLKKNPWVWDVGFHVVNVLVTADFKLSLWHRWMLSWEVVHSWLLQASLSQPTSHVRWVNNCEDSEEVFCLPGNW